MTNSAHDCALALKISLKYRKLRCKESASPGPGLDKFASWSSLFHLFSLLSCFLVFLIPLREIKWCENHPPRHNHDGLREWNKQLSTSEPRGKNPFTSPKSLYPANPGIWTLHGWSYKVYFIYCSSTTIILQKLKKSTSTHNSYEKLIDGLKKIFGLTVIYDSKTK